eukprot:1123078-Prorocentrum_minimum.AAC.1
MTTGLPPLPCPPQLRNVDVRGTNVDRRGTKVDGRGTDVKLFTAPAQRQTPHLLKSECTTQGGLRTTQGGLRVERVYFAQARRRLRAASPTADQL